MSSHRVDRIRWRIIGALHEHSPGSIAEGTDLSEIADDVMQSLVSDGPLTIDLTQEEIRANPYRS